MIFSWMKISIKIFLFILFLLLTLYVLLPTPKFPSPPPGAIQSTEMGDSEDVTVRRAYFTNFDRQQVLDYYKRQFSQPVIFNIPFISFRLNYPPEEAQTIIRDQTRSTFLEEIVHPLRESFFVNGFEPKVAKDDIWYKGVHYRQKITVKYRRSSYLVRIIVVVLIGTASLLLLNQIGDVTRRVKKITK
jgi:hypothetical protein